MPCGLRPDPPAGALLGIFYNDIRPVQAIANRISLLPLPLLSESFPQLEQVFYQRSKDLNPVFRGRLKSHPQNHNKISKNFSVMPDAQIIFNPA